MNIIIMTLHNPIDFPFHDWISLSGHNVFLILDYDSIHCTEEEFYLLSKNYTQVNVYKNYINNALIEYDIIEINKKLNIDLILTFGEDDILRAARLRENLNIEGQNLDSAILFRDKVEMKKMAKTCKIPIPKFFRLSNQMDLIHFVEQNGLPIFIKPLSSSGSVFTKAIRTQNEFIQFLEEGFKSRIPFSEYSADLIVEEFIEGDMYHIDGLVVNSEVIFAWPSKYLTQNLDLNALKNDELIGSYLLDAKNSLTIKLQEFAIKVIREFPMPLFSTFHLEIFLTQNENIIFCELACRTGGGKINKVINAAFNIDLNKSLFILQMNHVLKKPSCEQSETIYRIIKNTRNPKLYTGFFLLNPIVGKFLSGPKSCDLDFVYDFYLNASEGQIFKGRHYSGDNMGHVICTGLTELDLQKNILLAKNWVYERINFEKIVL